MRFLPVRVRGSAPATSSASSAFEVATPSGYRVRAEFGVSVDDIVRLIGGLERLGCEIPRSTLSDWVRAATDILEPLWKANREAVLVAGVLQADGTHLKVLDREHPNNIKRGSLWCFVGDGKYVHFEYAPKKSREGPLSLLRAREGPLVVDADTRLDSLFGAEDARAYEVGCWMHGRRRFVEALKGGEHMAAYPPPPTQTDPSAATYPPSRARPSSTHPDLLGRMRLAGRILSPGSPSPAPRPTSHRTERRLRSAPPVPARREPRWMRWSRSMVGSCP